MIFYFHWGHICMDKIQRFGYQVFLYIILVGSFHRIFPTSPTPLASSWVCSESGSAHLPIVELGHIWWSGSVHSTVGMDPEKSRKLDLVTRRLYYLGAPKAGMYWEILGLNRIHPDPYRLYKARLNIIEKSQHLKDNIQKFFTVHPSRPAVLDGFNRAPCLQHWCWNLWWGWTCCPAVMAPMIQSSWVERN